MDDIERLIKDLITYTQYTYDVEAQQPLAPGSKKKVYQSIAEMPGLKSTRDMELRYRVMGFPQSFAGETVLDLGCNLGRVCIDAVQRGASRAVGVDFNAEMIQVAKRFLDLRKRDLSEPTERIELYVFDLNQGLNAIQKLIGTASFDHVFALSIWGVVAHDKLFEIIDAYTKKFCWFEGHKMTGKYGDQSPEFIRHQLETRFKGKQVEFLGFADDDLGDPRANFKIHF